MLLSFPDEINQIAFCYAAQQQKGKLALTDSCLHEDSKGK